jgi:hypothetical protein
MMQRNRLQELLQHPDRVLASDREGLLVWSEKYPFAGGIAMLLARASAVGEHMDQEQDLLRAAAQGTYRQPLFDLILRTKLREEASDIDAFIEEMPDEAEATERLESVPDEHRAEPSESSSVTLNPDEPLEREALISAIGRTIEAEVDDWHEEEVENPSASTLADDDMGRIRGAVSSPFASWLASRAAQVGFGESQENEARLPQEPLDTRGLIDRFIEAQPKIGKLRDVEAPVEDWARESVLEDPTLVTETMARIYAKQGKIAKARKAYRHLSLKFPAKSTYFAAQLKKLDAASSGSADLNE